ncbi:hypothetical protein GCM10023168_30860 [Fodinibacter luteus]|uniref:HTH tetR-type domain-containing protein n=2 Tax=Fodinibacter luteus TaxID=552064 RepID=A0ABP8KMD5_9MICO
MEGRAASAERTRERVIDAMLGRFAAQPYDRIRLEDVAGDAGVTVQTVIRRFGGKPGLLTATVEREQARVVAAREPATPGRPAGTIADLVAHYERYGALILKVYAEADRVEGLPELAAAGRRYHLDWCRRAFEDDLAGPPGSPDRARRLAQVTVACDATTWRILRQDLGLDPEQTRLTIAALVEPALRRG